MKKGTIILLILCHISDAQIVFEKGYFIDNSGERVDCHIRNAEWKNNPSDFKYQLEDGVLRTATVRQVREFGISNASKYIRSTVKIDRSSDRSANLTSTMKPQFTEEQLFLQVLLEGHATLFKYEDGNLKRFFFRVGEEKIEQLIFKKYLTGEGQIAQNNTFRQQLWNNLKCSDIQLRDVEVVGYSQKELVKFFSGYHTCNDLELTSFERKSDVDQINWTIRPGINSASLTSDFIDPIDYGNKIGFRIGLEGELILPFNKNKWALLVEPSYQYYKAESEISNRAIIADYKSLDIPVGVRHYFFLNDNSKIFVNGSFVFSFSLNSKISLLSAFVEPKKVGYLAFGVGYNKDGKYSIELRPGTERDITSDNPFVESNFKSLSLIFGYTIF